MKKSVGYVFVVLHLAGSLFSGILGLAFVVLAGYLAYHEISSSGQVRFKFFMMPMMNILISSVLFYYCHSLYGSGNTMRKRIADGTFVMPQIRVTRYDIMAILGFLAFVTAVSFFVFGR